MHHEFLLVYLTNIRTLLLDIPNDLDRPTIALLTFRPSNSFLRLANFDQLDLKRFDPQLLLCRKLLSSVPVVDLLVIVVDIVGLTVESAQGLSRKSFCYPLERHLDLVLGRLF